eukprot:TRINITY_DN22867_c0_g1_i1.p1 TRINITY_DN22867_c0_g1~~TRINITY_DN22867_c0_g1_i1.p1  ORF type:complete len:190 (+),score=32.93 TRINITY_DN22867_c0_g1_i1:162-731(+)
MVRCWVVLTLIVVGWVYECSGERLNLSQHFDYQSEVDFDEETEVSPTTKPKSSPHAALYSYGQDDAEEVKVLEEPPQAPPQTAPQTPPQTPEEAPASPANVTVSQGEEQEAVGNETLPVDMSKEETEEVAKVEEEGKTEREKLDKVFEREGEEVYEGDLLKEDDYDDNDHPEQSAPRPIRTSLRKTRFF